MGRKVEKLYEDFAGMMDEIHSVEDPRRAYAIVQSRIQEFQSAGWAVPDDLIRVERNLMTECMAESQGR